MAYRGDYIVSGHFLNVGDYLVSANKVFFAIMQGDGNLCVYKGSSPGDNQGIMWASNSDKGQGNYFLLMQGDGNLCVYKGSSPGDNHGIVWASNSNKGQGNYFLLMQEDGNFCVYKGTGPGNNLGVVWAAGCNVDLNSMNTTDVVYDLDHVTRRNDRILASSTQILENTTSVEQSQNFAVSMTYSESNNWSYSNSTKIGISNTIKAGVPSVAEESVTISVEQTISTTVGGSVTETKSWTHTVPVRVPPHSKVKCVAEISFCDISIPFVSDVIFHFSNGNIKARVPGTYVGNLAYSLQTKWTEI